MSRITGTDAANLIEAYNSLYAPQEEVELTEEQVQEDFENWVNSLVEEGHDLSEYTWEEMYEHYLNEAPIRYSTGPTAADLQRQRAQASPRPAPTPSRPIRYSTGPSAADLQRQRQSQTAQNTGMYGRYAPPSMQQRTPAPARPPAAPAAPAARPTAQPVGSARPTPAPQKPTATATPPAAPSRYNPLMQKTFGYQTGNAPSQIAAASAGAPPAPTGGALGAAAKPEVRAALNLPARPAAATPAPAPTATPTAPKPPVKKTLTPTQMRQGISASFDPFDVVMGYLIDEGYAETEQAAAVIMANMSDEWREEILDEELTGKRKTRAVKKFNSQNENPGYPDTNLAAVATMRHGSRSVKNGNSNIYPADRSDTGNRPTKRGGSGVKGKAKTGYYDGEDELDRGSGNAARRRMENK